MAFIIDAKAGTKTFGFFIVAHVVNILLLCGVGLYAGGSAIFSGYEAKMNILYPGEWRSLYDFLNSTTNKEVEIDGLRNFKNTLDCPDGLTRVGYAALKRKCWSKNEFHTLFDECVVESRYDWSKPETTESEDNK